MFRQLLNISKEGDSNHPPRQPVSVLVHPQSEKVFLIFRHNLLYFSLCVMPLVLSLDTAIKSVALSSLHSPFRYLYALIRSLPEPFLLQAKQSQFSQPFLTGEVVQFLYRLHGPSLDSLQSVHVCLLLRT